MKQPSNTTFTIFLVLLTAGVYWNTLANDFVAGDRQFILRNSHLGDFDTVLSSLTSDYWGKLGGESFIYYRPLVIFSHFIDFRLYGLNPAGHHLSNIIIHAIATTTVYVLFLALLSGNRWCALAGASLFALHPIHTHSVSYVMGRTDVLAAVFYLWGLIFLMNIGSIHKRHLRMGLLLGACLCYLLALLCKEMAITLPLVFMFYCYCRDPKQNFWKNQKLLIPLLLLIITLGIYLAARLAAVGLSAQHSEISSWYTVGQRIGLVFITFGFYLQKLLFPLNLCYYSNIVVPAGFWEDVVRSSWFWGSIVWMTALTASLKYSSQAGLALGWIVLTALPVLNIIMTPDFAREHYLYIPSIGVCLLFSLMIASLLKHAGSKITLYRTLAYSMTIIIALLYAAMTMKRNLDYRDPRTFLQSTLTHMNPVALKHRHNPRYFEPVKNFYTAYRNLGILYEHDNQPEKAIAAFTSALEFTPPYFSPHYTASVKIRLGMLFYKAGREEEALAILREARLSGDNPTFIDNLIHTISIHVEENNLTPYDPAG